jgi:hypothetical protein
MGSATRQLEASLGKYAESLRVSRVAWRAARGALSGRAAQPIMNT